MKKLLLVTACGFLLTAGIANAQIHIRIGPPAPPREVVPPPPPEHRDWAWHAGFHRWEGDHYVWVPGYYVAPPHPHAVWVAGHWAHRGGEYVFVEGHWR